MKMDDWGKEPFDLRLTVLRLIRCFPGILAVILVATIAIGSAYYVKNIIFRKPATYSARVQFLVNYAAIDDSNTEKYINDNSWKVWMGTDEFAGYVAKYLPAGRLSEEQIKECLSAEILSDYRVVLIRARSEDPEVVKDLLNAVKPAMTEDFAEGFQDITKIRVTDTESIEEDPLDVRPVRAFLLAAVVSTLFTVAGFLLRELSLDRIYLPETISHRYGVRNCSVPGTALFQENMRYFFDGKETIAVCPTGPDLDAEKMIRELSDEQFLAAHTLMAVACPIRDAKTAETLRKADGILLAVGKKDGSEHIKLVLDFLHMQDLEVTAAVLTEPDKILLKLYYGLKNPNGD